MYQRMDRQTETCHLIMKFQEGTPKTSRSDSKTTFVYGFMF